MMFTDKDHKEIWVLCWYFFIASCLGVALICGSTEGQSPSAQLSPYSETPKCEVLLIIAFFGSTVRVLLELFLR